MLDMTPERIRFLRKRLGLSQAQLGQMMNVHQTLISHWEQGLRFPDDYQTEQLRHLYRSAQRLDEEQQKKVGTLLGAGLAAGALAFLIALGVALLSDGEKGQEDG